jgi:hypothetical protein
MQSESIQAKKCDGCDMQVLLSMEFSTWRGPSRVIFIFEEVNWLLLFINSEASTLIIAGEVRDPGQT